MHSESISDDPRAGVLEIVWNNGHSQQFRHGLRNQCKCADCKMVRLHTQDALMVAPEIRIKEIRPVGAYGMQLIFSDGHDRGIYPRVYLHGLAEDLAIPYNLTSISNSHDRMRASYVHVDPASPSMIATENELFGDPMLLEKSTLASRSRVFNLF
ncbi:DUF971 domain-containing protein [Undibacterium arcticum]|uniref:DUF971 domain-containing protein n=1 Tax=Undibacterium arcticum TaxID=1762892 RepID=UPI0036185C89